MRLKKLKSNILGLMFTVPISGVAMAEVPAGYYDSVDTTSAISLHQSLHLIIDDHQRFPYTSSSTDTWDILEQADEDPDNSGNVIDIYKNASYAKVGGGNTSYNREHSWPKSYGFPNDGSSNYAYTDAHHLFIANSSYNSSRSNKPYDNCNSACTEKTTDFNNGRGGTSSQSNWTEGSFTAGSWETWSGRRGDVARALMYMAVRYEGGVHGVTGHTEPDLILTDDRSLIEGSNQGSNISVAYMGLRSVLLQWHSEDPVDDFERRRNNAIFQYQGNRNPFIDHPEYVDCVFNAVCSGPTDPNDTTAPSVPTGLTAFGGASLVQLDWNANTESDLAGYNVYRSNSLGGTYSKLNNLLITTASYTDETVSPDTTYFYQITAVDTSGNESVNSGNQSATTDPDTTPPPSPQTAWINEFHYDNDGTDTNEFVEIAAAAGTDLTGWSVVGYNGNGGSVYKTVNLAGTVSNSSGGFGFQSVAFSGMQNGSPDGLALVNNTGEVVQFISYEGVLNATSGPATGMQSVDIQVSETSSTPVGYSLQLTGTGSDLADFSWQSAAPNTSNGANNNQVFTASQNQSPISDFAVNCTGLTCSVDGNTSQDPDGTLTDFSWDFGDGSSANGITAQHTYSSEGSYNITLTVTDNGGATASSSDNVTLTLPPATPVDFAATGAVQEILLSWTANTESDLAGYNLYSSSQPASGFVILNGSNLITGNSFTHAGLTDNQTVYYRLSAVDLDGNESDQSNVVSATTESSVVVSENAWINEIHYDNKGRDRNEFIEVAGNAGLDLTGWSLVGYNGNNGAPYFTQNLSGVISNVSNGFGIVSVNISGLQNGAADGVALVDASGNVVQFLSYEGVLTATSGVAAGLTSTDIGVAETSSTKVGESLQLAGTGSSYEDFTWQSAGNDTPSNVNNGQSFN